MALNRLRGLTAAFACLAFSALAVPCATAATGASAATGTGSGQVVTPAIAAAIKDQLALQPGGVVHGNTISYPHDVRMRFLSRPASTNKMSPAFYGCTTGNVCLYADTDFGGMVWETGSEWCPADHNHGEGGAAWLINTSAYHNVRSVDSENNYWARGYWVSWYGYGTQWTLSPQGDLISVSAQNFEELEVCTPPS
jgi:hypothetical protein